MNSLDGLSYTSNNLSGLSVGNFDNINFSNNCLVVVAATIWDYDYDYSYNI